MRRGTRLFDVVVTVSFTERLPANFFGETTLSVILPVWATALSVLPFGAVMVTVAFWPLLSVTVRKTSLSRDGSLAPFFKVPMATGAFVTVAVCSLETMGLVAADATPAVARAPAAAVMVMTRNAFMDDSVHAKLARRAST